MFSPFINMLHTKLIAITASYVLGEPLVLLLKHWNEGFSPVNLNRVIPKLSHVLWGFTINCKKK